VSPRPRAEMLRDEMVMHDRIAALLRERPMTIPALAEALGHPAPEVVCWVMAMRRYGMVEEEGKADDDGYFAYTLTEKAAGEGETA
jgi:predicted Rossmann fold nucleotide-binding protein DprA/Smf involved in DNA uptake